MQLMDNEKIGQFIATRRKGLGMTQKELGERLFVSDKTVSKWERGASLPNVALLQPLAEVLEVGVSDLLNGECQLQEAKTSDAAISHALILSLQETHLHEQRHWRLLFASALIVTLLEGALLFFLTGSFQAFGPVGCCSYLPSGCASSQSPGCLPIMTATLSILFNKGPSASIWSAFVLTTAIGRRS